LANGSKPVIYSTGAAMQNAKDLVIKKDNNKPIIDDASMNAAGRRRDGRKR
jgi:hypothetical protein